VRVLEEMAPRYQGLILKAAILMQAGQETDDVDILTGRF
jgi:hypothetical protein